MSLIGYGGQELQIFAIGHQPPHTIIQDNNAHDVTLPDGLEGGGIVRICCRGRDAYILIREPGDTRVARRDLGFLLPNEAVEYIILTPGQTMSAIKAQTMGNDLHLCLARCKLFGE